MYKILIVEDDPTIREVLKRHLTKWGYLVQGVHDFQTVLEDVQTVQPHLVLLDISLPFFNGYHWCEQIRTFSQMPILFLSSASDDMNVVMAMNLGADDFIVKPFNLDVVTAKIQALLRRAYSFGAERSMLTFGDLTLNLGETKLRYNAGELELTKNECKILQLLMEAKGSIVTRETIMKKLWDDESFIDDNTLTVNVARLRKKLSDLGLVDLISTKKGLGYFLKR